MTTSLSALVHEALTTGTLTGLPSRHFIDGGFEPSVSGEDPADLRSGQRAAGGGLVLSGFGREKGMEALRSYRKIKSVVARI